ncbi:hypothetical protein G7Y79_00033g068590 [Physcia stellaris]|nr:hypothetical protein G7Y79_00033g068590 [Physcia stellaris]
MSSNRAPTRAVLPDSDLDKFPLAPYLESLDGSFISTHASFVNDQTPAGSITKGAVSLNVDGIEHSSSRVYDLAMNARNTQTDIDSISETSNQKSPSCDDFIAPV